MGETKTTKAIGKIGSGKYLREGCSVLCHIQLVAVKLGPIWTLGLFLPGTNDLLYIEHCPTRCTNTSLEIDLSLMYMYVPDKPARGTYVLCTYEFPEKMWVDDDGYKFEK